MKPVRKEHQSWLKNRWPLIDMNMTRMHCLEWMKAKGYPRPPRSACVFCPYHSNTEWQRLKTEEPAAFQQAVEFEVKFQEAFAQVKGFRGEVFLHRDLVPLGTIDFSAPDHQADMFGNECEGHCGV